MRISRHEVASRISRIWDCPFGRIEIDDGWWVPSAAIAEPLALHNPRMVERSTVVSSFAIGDRSGRTGAQRKTKGRSGGSAVRRDRLRLPRPSATGETPRRGEGADRPPRLFPNAASSTDGMRADIDHVVASTGAATGRLLAPQFSSLWMRRAGLAALIAIGERYADRGRADRRVNRVSCGTIKGRLPCILRSRGLHTAGRRKDGDPKRRNHRIGEMISLVNS